jgi:hypothetical protein
MDLGKSTCTLNLAEESTWQNMQTKQYLLKLNSILLDRPRGKYIKNESDTKTKSN